MSEPTWQKIAVLGSGSSSGGSASSSANPILSDIGILYNKASNPSGYWDFVVPGASADNTETFRFKMPYDGWVLGFSIYGSIQPAQSPGYYVSAKDLNGNYNDIIHVDPSIVPTSDLTEGYTYYSSAPPMVPAGYMIALKLNNQQQADYDLTGFIHVQYDPTSVAKLAMLQQPSAPATTTTNSGDDDVAILDLGHLYCKDGELPTDSGSALQLVDTYVDRSDNSVLAINNSRFAPFDCYITSAAICQQSGVNTNLYVNIMTQGGTFQLTVPYQQAHTEQTFGDTQYYVPQGGYFYANAYGDSSDLGGNPVSLSCLLTLKPASNQ